MKTQFNVKLEPQLKQEAQQLFKTLGLSTTTAITVFLRACINCGGIPFPLTTVSSPEKEIAE